jgi:hypothetical protein
MPIMKITELSDPELLQLVDNRRTIIQDFLHDNYVVAKIKEAIDEVRAILDEIDIRITV